MVRKHAFVSFTDRVAAIRIDPIRRSEKKRNTPDAANSESLFMSALERWSELNLATQFTTFSSQCNPLVQSLPMLIYNQSKVFDLLSESIEGTDEYSIEPLLDLLVQLARDLGEDFETFYPRAVRLCINLIQKNQKDDKSLGTVELAFNCLAHLFKYLSRLLTTNLIPTYDLLLPLFGGERGCSQRSFVLRFAAESMSFLVRRATGDGLRQIVDHIVSKVASDSSNAQYMSSSSQLLASTLKGPQTSLHSKTPVLLDVYFESCHNYDIVDLYCSIITEGLHHVRQDTAGPIYSSTLACINRFKDEFSSRCLFVLSGLRKGDRVSDWEVIYDSLIYLAPSTGMGLSWCQAAAAVICHSNVYSTTRHLKEVLSAMPDLEAITRVMKVVHTVNKQVFLAFQNIFWLEALQKLEKENDHHLKLLALLCIDIGFPESIQVITTFNKAIRANTLCSVKLADGDNGQSLFTLWWRALLCKTHHNINRELLCSEVLKLVSDSDNQALDAFKAVVVGHLLTQETEIDISQAAKLPFHPVLMDAVRLNISNHGTDQTSLLETFIPHLLPCLMSCDQNMRRSALQLLKTFVNPQDDSNSLLDQCAVINEIPCDLENARNISQRLRNLATKYKISGTNTKGSEIVSNAALHFFFGMLTTRLQPVWSIVLELIPKLCEKDSSEVCRLAMIFIENPRFLFPSNLIIGGDEKMQGVPKNYPEYEILDCHTLETLQKASEVSWCEFSSVTESLETRAMNSLTYEHYDDVRALGTKVLLEIPQIAEKSVVRSLVPHLLSVEEDEEDADQVNNNASSGEEFTLKDKLLLLELFSKLKTPERLPCFQEIKDRYLYFLSSRHSPLQRLGLKCLLAVNSSETKVLRKYRSNFDAMLDDKRFRDELLSFICAGEEQLEEGSLHPDDRPVIMPYVVRVLYGRAQNGTKRNMRHAALSSLHFLLPEYLTMFVELAHSHLMDSEVMKTNMDFSDRAVSRKVQGYLTLLGDFAHHLKTAIRHCVPYIVKGGIFPILSKINLDENKILRQLVTKNLESLFSCVPIKLLWEPLYPTVYEMLIKPQLAEFASRNHENASTLMRLLLTISNESELIGMLDEKTVVAVCSCIVHSSIKDSVIIHVLKFAINFTTFLPDSPVTHTAISTVVKYLPPHMEKELSVECFSVAVDAINKMFSLGVNSFSEDVIHNIALVSFGALKKPSRLVPLPVKGSLLHALSQILDSPQCSLELIKMAYDNLAPLFRQFVSHDHRLHLSACYHVFGKRHEEYFRVGQLITELNSYDAERLGDPDFVRRSIAFEQINEKDWNEFSETEWKPLMFNMLFFIRDPEELALRNNGKYALMRMIESQNAKNLVSEFVLPAIKRGLRDEDDKFRRICIDLLSQCAHHDVLPTLNVLLYNGDEEADFFVNVNHVQVHRRRRALQRLGKHAKELDGSVIAHYLLSIVENFASFSGSKNNDVNNLAVDALNAITELLKHVSPGQFKSVARRCVQNVLQGPEPAKLRKSARVITAVAQATPHGIDEFVLTVLVAPLHRFLSAKSNEHENLPDRVPLAVAIVYFLKALEKQTLEIHLPGKLTSLCHLLRSKIPEMRDTVRQSLGKIARILGAEYLKFVVSELFGSLRRGGMQSHVLGYTVHQLLVELNRRDQQNPLQVGDFDESAGIIFRIIMNDTFGSIGEEKDADNYVTAAKEVKQHKSYDTAEILATWVSLSQFGRIIEPMRHYLSGTKLNGKGEHKVEEVLRRLAAGLHKNPQATTQDAIVMGYEVFSLCDRVINERNATPAQKTTSEKLSGSLMARENAAKESEAFFTVRLSARDWYDGNGDSSSNYADRASRYASSNLHLLQTFALETLRSVLTSTSGGATSDAGKGLLTVANVKGLMPIIVKGLESTHEDLNISALRLATIALKLPVPFSESDNTLEVCGTQTLHFIEASTDTNSLICQTALKFLTMLVRSKPEFELNSGAVAYVLERLRPDLEEPERQSTAISFIRSIFARKVMLPQVYDIADTISKVLVTNQSDHIRVNCRAAYLHFLTTYPLGKTRLDRHLEALGVNLRFAAPSGRLSVMEMIHSLLQRIQVDQLESAFIQYFASLVLILVTDTEPECRERALSLTQELVNATFSSTVRGQMIEYCSKWLESLGKNDLLVRGGLEVAKMLISKPGAEGLNKQLNKVVADILQSGQRSSQTNIEWQLVYLALDHDVSHMMNLVEGVLLFPHPWVRAKATRAFGHYFKSTPKSAIQLNILARVGYKMVRQLGAPKLSSADGLQIVKNLVFIIPLWDTANARMNLIHVEDEKAENKHGDNSDQLCVDWLCHKLGTMIRTDVSAVDLVGGKTGAVQVLASLPSILSKESSSRLAYDAIMSLYVLNEQLAAENAHQELADLAQEAMSLYNQALGTTEYLKLYTKAQKFVQDRRRARRSKRSIEAVADPETFAQKKMKRNAHKRDVRKMKKQKT